MARNAPPDVVDPPFRPPRDTIDPKFRAPRMSQRRPYGKIVRRGTAPYGRHRPYTKIIRRNFEAPYTRHRPYTHERSMFRSEWRLELKAPKEQVSKPKTKHHAGQRGSTGSRPKRA